MKMNDETHNKKRYNTNRDKNIDSRHLVGPKKKEK